MYYLFAIEHDCMYVYNYYYKSPIVNAKNIFLIFGSYKPIIKSKAKSINAPKII